MANPDQNLKPWENLDYTRFSLENVDEGTILDTQTELETPEGALLEFRTAGIAARGTAFLLDEIIKWIIIIAIYLVFTSLGIQFQNLAAGLYLILFFVLGWFYGVLFELFNDGMTLGKVATNIRAVNGDGTPINFTTAAIRNLFRPIDSISILSPGLSLGGVGIPGALIMLFSDRFRRIGDHLANTMVIHVQKDVPLLKEDDQNLAAQIFPTPLTRHEQQSLIEFQDRIGSLTPDRARELAELLHPIHGKLGEEAVTTCLEYANAIRGVL